MISVLGTVGLSFADVPMMQDHVLVKYKQTVQPLSLQSVQQTDSFSTSFTKVPLLPGESPEQAILRLQQDANIEHVQPNYIYRLFSFPTPIDVFFPSQYYLDNQGTSNQFPAFIVTGTSGADISWLSGMAIFSGVVSTGTTGNLIAVIDDGVLYPHQDLSGRMRD